VKFREKRPSESFRIFITHGLGVFLSSLTYFCFGEKFMAIENGATLGWLLYLMVIICFIIGCIIGEYLPKTVGWILGAFGWIVAIFMGFWFSSHLFFK
jgi:hypothetical protein